MCTDIRYRQVFQLLQHPAVILEPDSPHYTIADTNQRFSELCGIDTAALINRPFPLLPFFNENKDITAMLDKAALLADTGWTESLIPVSIAKPGTHGAELRNWKIGCNPLTTDAGQTGYIVLSVTDITEQEEMEAKTRESIRVLEDRNSFIETILESLPIGIAVNRISNGEATTVNKKFAEIYGWKEEDLIDINVFFQKVYPDPNYRKAIMARILGDIRSGDPGRMMWNGIAVTTSTGDTRYVNAKNIPLFKQDLMISTVVDVTTEKLQRDEIFRTRANLTSLINASPDFIWAVDVNLRLITANESFRKFISAFTGETFKNGDLVLFKAFGDEQLSKWKSYYEKALSGEPLRVSESLFDPSIQDTRYNIITLDPMFDERDVLIGVACYSKDVTEQTKNMIALQEKEEELNKIMRSSLDVICTITKEGIFRQVSHAAKDIWGYEPEELCGRFFLNYVYAEDQAATSEMATRVLSGTDIHDFENRYLSKDGRLVEMVWSAGWDTEYQLAFCVGRDATEKKKTEQKIQESEKLLNEAQRLAKMGSWNFDFRKDKLTWSDPLYDVFGVDKNIFQETHGSFVDLIVEEDREFAVRTSKHAQETGESFNIEYRIKTPAGEERVIEEFGFSEKDETGHILRLFGTAQDITARKKAEELLKQSEEKYKYLFENNPSPMILWDFDTFSIIDCNEEALMMYGYTREEFLGLSIRDIRPASDVELINRFYGNADLYGRIQKGVWRHKKKNGELMFVDISGHMMDYTERKTVLVQVIDITARLEAERKLSESEKKYNDLFRLNPQPLLIIDLTTKHFVQVNHAATAHYGFTEAEFRKMTIDDLKVKLDTDKAEVAGEQGKKRKDPYSGRHRHLKKNGEVIDVDIYSSPITLKGIKHRFIIAIDITEKIRFDQEITKAIIRTQEVERYEVGAELHDNVCQILAASQMSLSMIKNVNEDRRKFFLEKTTDYIGMATDAVRKLSHRLAPAFQHDTTLQSSIEKLLENFNLDNQYHIDLHFSSSVDTTPVNQEIQLNIYRILQEQLRNIRKHAEARSINIDVSVRKKNLILITTDDGKGFDTSVAGKGIGLANITRRVEIMNGSIDIHSAPGQGCTITISIPLK
jgi:PAS domain S-box-containing protein